MTASFQRCCRLCAEEQDVTIMIYSKEAEDMLLQNKLNKYLLIEVDEDDKLPKNICIQCCSKLQIVCDFIDTARKAQDVLYKRSLQLKKNKIRNGKQMKNDTLDYDEEIVSSPIKVNVDPLTKLENNDNFSADSIGEKVQSSEDNVSQLHSFDGDYVTIKLIKRVCGPIEEKRPFECHKCDRAFSTEIALKNHLWLHSDSEKQYTPLPHICISCLADFATKDELLEHLKSHSIKGMCKVCGKRFRNEANLSRHMAFHSQKEQSTDKSYLCNVCGRSYKSSSTLKTHSITHSNERPYTCSECKKSFKRKQHLRFHINQHTGARPFKCPLCDKSFASSGNCYAHKTRMHPDAMPKKRRPYSRRNKNLPPRLMNSVAGKFQCTYCEHSFINKDNFTYHMYQHTGEKPFQCRLCNEKFVTRKGLSLHHSRSHPGWEIPNLTGTSQTAAKNDKN